MLTAANAIVNKPIQALNELIAALNQFAGTDFEPVSLSNMGASIARELETVRQAQSIAMEDIRETMMKPMPSGQFKEFVEDAREASEIAAGEALKINTALTGGEGEGGQGGRGTDAKEALEEKLNRIRESNMSELELLQQKLDEEIAIINSAKAAELITREEWDALTREQRARHEDELTRIEEDAAKARQRVHEDELKAKQATMGQILSNMSTLMNTESRKMFEIGKAAGIANSIISTYTGASKALELGWPLGPIAAAAITAKGFAQVQSIRSQSFGGGGSPTNAGGSATGNVNAASQGIQDPNQRPQTVANVSLVGDVFSRDSVKGLMEQMGDLFDDGMRIRVS